MKMLSNRNLSAGRNCKNAVNIFRRCICTNIIIGQSNKPCIVLGLFIRLAPCAGAAAQVSEALAYANRL